MNLEKVIFGFFIISACTLNFGFFIGDHERVELHHPMELFAAVVVNLIATGYYSWVTGAPGTCSSDI